MRTWPEPRLRRPRHAQIAAREGRVRRTVWWLLGTAALGLLFLAIKGYEYRSEYVEGLMPGVGPPFPLESGAELFFNLYFAATGLHAVHLTLGIAAVVAFAWAAVGSGRLRLPVRSTPVEGLGMYWHLVDVIWVFFYPALYLV